MNPNQHIQTLTTSLLTLKKSDLNNADLMQKTVEELREVLNHHDWLYYVQAEPVIKDTDYDYLFDYLKAIEKSYPHLLTPDSPTQRVARGLVSDLQKVNHTVPMLSLDKAYTNEDLKSWDETVKKLVEEDKIEYWVEPKFDGSSVAMIYENDLLVRGATRGNGIVGDDITNNIKTLGSIPLSAKFSELGLYKVEVRGEVVIHKEKFIEINKKREAAGTKLLANARNAAAGALRQKDSSRLAERKLEAFVYQIAYAADKDGNDTLGTGSVVNQSDAIHILYQQNFKTPLEGPKDFSMVCKGIDEAIAYCEHWQKIRDDYPYDIDGMVIKVNNMQLQGLAGATNHHPRWAIALKFDAKQAITKLEGVDFQVGRTGAITPVARLETVNVAGANITNVSLHNEDFISEKDIHIGDMVVVERAGDVIPYIVEVLPEERDGSETPVTFPTNCPSCAAELVKPEGESIWRCVNTDCPAQIGQHIIHFVSKSSMDISNLGASIVQRFIELGYINTIEDIFRLPYDEIATLDGFGERSVENLKTSIEAAKQMPMNRLIVGLGIREVGRTMSKTLANAVNELTELKDWDEDKLMELEDIGPKVAANIYTFFGQAENLQLIENLKALGVNTKRLASETKVQGGIFAGKTFLFTGSLQQFKRAEAKKMVEDNGGKVISAVSSKLHYLVVGEKAGSKLTKAQKIGTIEILSEDDFLAMMNQDD